MLHTDPIRVTMLGGFSIAQGGRAIDDGSNRMRKVWLLLAFLILSRRETLPIDRYLALLQEGGDTAADPGGRVKAMFYRARTLLDQLGEGTGHAWIIRRDGNYAWNCDLPLTVDAEEFEALCRAASAEQGSRRLALQLQALDLYKGDLLPRLSMEPWVMPRAAWYHQLYLDTAVDALGGLTGEERWPEALELCTRALRIEPYSEELYQYLMRCRMALGDRAGAVSAYDEMSELLFSTFGVMPSDESRALYREASREAESHALPVGDLRDLLREPEGGKGALYCEYDFFRLLYQLQARTILRTGDVVHIALLSVHGQGGKPLARRSLDRAMDNLQATAIGSLRQSDVVSRCSLSQLLIMLPQANYENSGMVCRRILKAFNRQYPHSPAVIQYSVQPLEPRMPDLPHSHKNDQ